MNERFHTFPGEGHTWLSNAAAGFRVKMPLTLGGGKRPGRMLSRDVQRYVARYTSQSRQGKVDGRKGTGFGRRR